MHQLSHKTVQSKLIAIPYRAYNGLRAISIYFNADGTPKMNNKWFQFSCKNFKDMAEIKEAA